MRADQIGIAVATPIGAALLYLLVAGEVSAAEAIAAVAVVAIASFYAVALARNGSLPLMLHRRGARVLAKALLGLAPETVRVATRLLHAIRHRPDAAHDEVAHQPFRFGGATAADAGRRATVITALSLAPNGFALGTDDTTGDLLIHRLVPAPVSPDREWPS